MQKLDGFAWWSCKYRKVPCSSMRRKSKSKKKWILSASELWQTGQREILHPISLCDGLIRDHNIFSHLPAEEVHNDKYRCLWVIKYQDNHHLLKWGHLWEKTRHWPNSNLCFNLLGGLLCCGIVELMKHSAPQWLLIFTRPQWEWF